MSQLVFISWFVLMHHGSFIKVLGCDMLQMLFKPKPVLLFSVSQPHKDSLLLPLLIVARVAFIPLFMLCNIQPRLNLPVFFHHDAWFIVFMLLFAFSNGYLASLCMCFGPK